jgi:DNA-binding transcriptional LysR family regulator
MNNYKLFITIVSEGSFSKAAEKLGITQPTVSKQIDRLEEKLGGQLFKRSTRKLLLTAAGERYFERAQEIDAIERATENEVRRIATANDSLLRINTSRAIAAEILPSVLMELKNKHPQARFHLLTEEANSTAYYQHSFALDYDLFIREGEPAESSMNARLLARVPQGFYASPQYLAEHGVPTSVESLSKDHFCLGVRLSRANPWLEKMLGDFAVENLDWLMTGNDSASIVPQAEAGLGVVFVTQNLVESALARGTLVALDIGIELATMPITALYRKDYFTPLARECLDLLIEHMGNRYPDK